jgi:F0F1-type ATP synthase membrane subunit b/b'
MTTAAIVIGVVFLYYFLWPRVEMWRAERDHERRIGRALNVYFGGTGDVKDD